MPGIRRSHTSERVRWRSLVRLALRVSATAATPPVRDQGRAGCSSWNAARRADADGHGDVPEPRRSWSPRQRTAGRLASVAFGHATAADAVRLQREPHPGVELGIDLARCGRLSVDDAAPAGRAGRPRAWSSRAQTGAARLVLARVRPHVRAAAAARPCHRRPARHVQDQVLPLRHDRPRAAGHRACRGRARRSHTRSRKSPPVTGRRRGGVCRGDRGRSRSAVCRPLARHWVSSWGARRRSSGQC